MFGIGGLTCIVAFLVSGWWYSQKDQPRLMADPAFLKTNPIPASVGFTAFFASAFVLLFMVSPFSLSIGPIFAYGLLLSAIGIFLPYVLLSKEQRATTYASTWTRKISFAIFIGGLMPVIGLIFLDRYFKSGALITGLIAVAVLIAIIFLWRKTRKYRGMTINPVLIQSVKTYDQFRFAYVAILLLAIIVMLILHKHGVI